MRALILTDHAQPATVGELADPEPRAGDALVEVLAAALNPMDVMIAAGSYRAGHPPLPYAIGGEAVGRIVRSDVHPPGTLVWTGFASGLGIERSGAIAELVATPEDDVLALAEGTDPAIAVSLGVAGLAGWLPVSRHAPVRAGETVLVLGATGTVGSIALQGARVLGAGRVVAAGRDASLLERATELGADATVVLDDGDDLADRMRDACGGDGPNLIIDPVWGRPIAAAVDVAAPHARIVQIGQSAGAEASLASGPIRGKELSIIGFSGWLAREEANAGFLELLDHVQSGRIQIEIERVPLADAADAWQRQQRGPRTKLIITTQEG